MKKWLEQQGATFLPGKGSHLKVFLNGKQSNLPMHGTAELGKGLEAAIKRQLGLVKCRRFMMFEYPVTVTPDGDAWLVTFVDVPEAITFGSSPEEALRNAVDALETGLSFYVDSRQPLPVASPPASGQKTVRPTALECAKLGVYQAMTEQGIKKAELARRLGWHTPQVDRLFDLQHASRLDQIEAAAKALGKDLWVQVA
jgi:antitoxin HicB